MADKDKDKDTTPEEAGAGAKDENGPTKDTGAEPTRKRGGGGRAGDKAQDTGRSEGRQGEEGEKEAAPPPPTTTAPTTTTEVGTFPAEVPTSADAPSAQPQTTEGVPREQAEAEGPRSGLERDAEDAERKEAGRDGRPTPEDQRVQADALAAPLEAPETRPGVRTTQREHRGPDTMDEVAGAAGIQSLFGENATRLVDEDGNEVSGSDLFDESGSGTLVRAKQRVHEEFTPRNARTPSRRLLLSEGQEVTRARAEAIKAAVAELGKTRS